MYNLTFSLKVTFYKIEKNLLYNWIESYSKASNRPDYDWICLSFESPSLAYSGLTVSHTYCNMLLYKLFDRINKIIIRFTGIGKYQRANGIRPAAAKGGVACLCEIQSEHERNNNNIVTLELTFRINEVGKDAASARP